MKKVICILALAASLPIATWAQARDSAPASDEETIDGHGVYEVCRASIIGNSEDVDVTKWKIGDTMQYEVNVSNVGRVGDSTKKVTKDEGHAVWVRQSVQILFHRETVEVLVNKADGKILKVVRNGKEQPPEDNKFEVIKEERGVTVKVPAGEFTALYYKGKMKDVQSLEVWASPSEALIEGSVKQVITVSLGTVTMELKEMKRGNGVLEPEEPSEE